MRVFLFWPERRMLAFVREGQNRKTDPDARKDHAFSGLKSPPLLAHRPQGGNPAAPIAMGELFNTPHEWIETITQRLYNFSRYSAH